MNSAQVTPIKFKSGKFSKNPAEEDCGCVSVPHIPNNNPINPSHRPGWIYLFELLDIATPAGHKAYKVGKYEDKNLDQVGFIEKLKRRNRPYYRQTYGCRFRIIHLISVECAEGGEKQATRLWKEKQQRNEGGHYCEKYFLIPADVMAFKNASGTVLYKPIQHIPVTTLLPRLKEKLDIRDLPLIP